MACTASNRSLFSAPAARPTITDRGTAYMINDWAVADESNISAGADAALSAGMPAAQGAPAL